MIHDNEYPHIEHCDFCYAEDPKPVRLIRDMLVPVVRLCRPCDVAHALTDIASVDLPIASTVVR